MREPRNIHIKGFRNHLKYVVTDEIVNSRYR
jgi:hypothetical protein